MSIGNTACQILHLPKSYGMNKEILRAKLSLSTLHGNPVSSNRNSKEKRSADVISVFPPFQPPLFFVFFFLSEPGPVSTVTYYLRLSKITSRMVLRSRVAFALTLLHNSMSMSSQDVVRAVTYFRLANILSLYALYLN
jgi:hypothetical protein